VALSLGLRSCAVGVLFSVAASGATPPLTPAGPEFQVNTYTTSVQRFPSVAAHADGDVVVVWDSLGSSGDDTSSYSIQAQRYTTAAAVPSLSPAALVAAALLVCLVGSVLRARA
jgi:hypothetical protein